MNQGHLFKSTTSLVLAASTGHRFSPAGDQLSLYVYSHSDGNFDVENESGFSVYRLPATEGMFAGYNTVYTVGGDTWHVVSRTA